MKKILFISLFLFLFGYGCGGATNDSTGRFLPVTSVAENPPNPSAASSLFILTESLESANIISTSKKVSPSSRKSLLRQIATDILLHSYQENISMAKNFEEEPVATCTEDSATMSIDCKFTQLGSKGGEVTFDTQIQFEETSSEVEKAKIKLKVDMQDYAETHQCGQTVSIDGNIQCDWDVEVRYTESGVSGQIGGQCDTLSNLNSTLSILTEAEEHKLGLDLTVDYQVTISGDHFSDEFNVEGVVHLNGVNYQYKDVQNFTNAQCTMPSK